jgi:hypothetical protein
MNLQAMINFTVIFCIAVPIIALANIIRIIVSDRKSKRENHEKLMDILTEYQIKAEKKNDNSEEEK